MLVVISNGSKKIKKSIFDQDLFYMYVVLTRLILHFKAKDHTAFEPAKIIEVLREKYHLASRTS